MVVADMQQRSEIADLVTQPAEPLPPGVIRKLVLARALEIAGR